MQNKPTLAPEVLELAKQCRELLTNNIGPYTSAEQSLFFCLIRKVEVAFDWAEEINEWEKGVE